MPIDFSRTVRSIQDDRYPVFLLLLVMFSLIIWGSWFFLAEVTLYERSSMARLELDRAATPVEATVDGYITAINMKLEQQVSPGDVLVELDPREQQLQKEEIMLQLEQLELELVALESEMKAGIAAFREAGNAARFAVSQNRASYREAEVEAELARKELFRARQLNGKGFLSDADLTRAYTKAESERARLEAIEFAIRELEVKELELQENHKVETARLARERKILEGQIGLKRASRKRLNLQIEKRLIKARVEGHLAEYSGHRIGSFVETGENLGTILGEGNMKVIAWFSPAAALGRIRVGQAGRFRLYGFPWAEFGSIRTRVARIATESRDGKVRVELYIVPDPEMRIPLQHGLSGYLEIAIDRISPAQLTLRTVGRKVGQKNSEEVTHD